MVNRAQEEFPNELGSKWSENTKTMFTKKEIYSSHRKSLLPMLRPTNALALQQNASSRIQSGGFGWNHRRYSRLG